MKKSEIKQRQDILASARKKEEEASRVLHELYERKVLFEKEQESREKQLDEQERAIQAKETKASYELDVIADFIHEQRHINQRMDDSVDKLRKEISYVKGQGIVPNASAKLIDNLSKSIGALCEISNLRMEMLEFCNAPNLFNSMGSDKIPIYSTFEKLYKSINNGSGEDTRKFDLGEKGTFAVYTTKRVLPIAFFILLQNAKKYTIPGETIHIRFDEREDCLYVEIENWGPKLEYGEVARLTDRKFRGKNAILATGAGGGKGLGLGIAKDILTRCGVSYEITIPCCEPKKYKGVEYGLFNVRLCFTPVE